MSDTIYIPLLPRQHAILVVHPANSQDEARLTIYVEAGESAPASLDLDREARKAIAAAMGDPVVTP